MLVSRLLFAGVALGLVVCAFVTALMPQPWRMISFALTAGLALVLAYTSAAATAGGPRESLPGLSQTPPGEERANSVQPPSGLRDVVEALPVGVIILGEDARIRAFNRAAGEIFDVLPERAYKRAVIEIVRSFELDRRLMATLRDGAEETAEVMHAGVQERCLQVTTRLLRDASGRPEALAIISDLTRMRDLESLRRDFVSNVSHELRTPLTAVKLMVETLQSGVEPAAAGEFLTSIGQETERMITLVEDLLDLSRLETRKLELRLRAVDVGELCRDAVGRHMQRASSLGLDIECIVPRAAIVVSADRDKLYQVLVNLLDNALRHTPAGGKVSVSAAREHGSVQIVVQDTGSGIPSTALAHIFERFFVVDAARARSRSGTGLGLAIVKHIVEAHGGSISVVSELGVGTAFRCLLPA